LIVSAASAVLNGWHEQPLIRDLKVAEPTLTDNSANFFGAPAPVNKSFPSSPFFSFATTLVYEINFEKVLGH
jgi:hypothetical protein